MPNQETRILDDIITSRRALLVGGGAALATLAMPTAAKAANTVTSYTDTDILNFALNLEYLEANFYYMAAFGTTIDMPQTAAGAATQQLSGVLGNNPGKAVGTFPANSTAGVTAQITGTAASNKVPFTNSLVAAYAQETAVEEGKHVAFLRSALGSAAVAQPVLNLTVANFAALAGAAGIAGASGFNPFANDAFFLLGAYIFEDVGVSAYHGAAPLITNKTTILPAAVGIHAVEAYHAGLVRTSIYAFDAANTFGLGVGTLTHITQQISTLRQTLASNMAVLPTTANPEDPQPDDYGVVTQMVSLNGGAATTASQIVDADPKMVTGFARSTSQVLNIVTGGGAQVAGTPATGIFYPNGLNGLFI